MRKHLNKILVLFLNLFLMAVAVLVIESKDQEKRATNAKNSLREENDSLKYELDTLKGVLQNFELQTEKVIDPIAKDAKTDSAANNDATQPVPANQPTANSAANTNSSNNPAKKSNASSSSTGSNNNSSGKSGASASSNNTSSNQTTPTTSNAKTKTS